MEKKAKFVDVLSPFYWPLTIGVLLVMTFFVGRLSAEVEVLKGKGGSAGAVAVTPQAAPAQQAAPTPVAVSIDLVKALFDKNLVKFGDARKKALVVVVSDPSCPYCSAASGMNGSLNKQLGTQFILKKDGGSYVAPVPEMKRLVDSGKAGLVYLYANGHGNGEMGAKALMCAFEKNRFWQAEEKLMSADGYNLLNNTVKNDKSKAGDLAKFLAGAVDEKFMLSCLESGKYDSRIAEEAGLAASLGTQGTPAFIVNTTKFAGAYSYEQIEPTVKQIL